MERQRDEDIDFSDREIPQEFDQDFEINNPGVVNTRRLS